MNPDRTILHVGNVANNAYENARLMKEAGERAFVADPDLYHFAACPEWTVLGSLDRKMLGDDFFPNFFRIAGAKAARPRWFAQGPQLQVLTYLRLLIDGEPGAEPAWCMLQYQRLKAVFLRTTVPQLVLWDRAQFDEALTTLEVAEEFREELETGWRAEQLTLLTKAMIARFNGQAAADGLSAPFPTTYIDSLLPFDDELRTAVEEARATGLSLATGFEQTDFPPRVFTQPPEVTDADWAAFTFVLPAWRETLEKFGYVFLYGSAPYYAYLCGYRPYAAYEFGTIRRFPFEDSITGRLVKLSYLNAAAVLITNTDYITAEPRLEFEADRRFFTPHAFDERPLRRFASDNPRPTLAEPRIVQFFAPARQDWVRADPQWSKGNDWCVRALALLKEGGADNVRLTFVEWGEDVAATKGLIEELGVGDSVCWVAPLPKAELWRRYLASDAIIDQFLISVISGVTFESLAIGRRVITRDDGLCNRVFFDEDSPPLLPANSMEELAARMRQVVDDPDDHAGVGAAAAAWTDRRHSAARIVEIGMKVMDRLDEDRRPKIATPQPTPTLPPYPTEPARGVLDRMKSFFSGR